MPAAQDGDAQESGEEAGQHAFEFMDSVRSVGPTGSGEGGAGRRDALQEQALAEHEHESEAPSVGAPDRRHVISPLVARLSAQYGIDLSTLQGTGTGGRITSKDLLDAVSRMTAGTREEEADEPEAAEAAAEASPVIPAQAGIQGARAAHEEEAGSVEGMEAVAEPEAEPVTAAARTRKWQKTSRKKRRTSLCSRRTSRKHWTLLRKRRQRLRKPRLSRQAPSFPHRRGSRVRGQRTRRTWGQWRAWKHQRKPSRTRNTSPLRGEVALKARVRVNQCGNRKSPRWLNLKRQHPKTPP